MSSGAIGFSRLEPDVAMATVGERLGNALGRAPWDDPILAISGPATRPTPRRTRRDEPATRPASPSYHPKPIGEAGSQTSRTGGTDLPFTNENARTAEPHISSASRLSSWIDGHGFSGLGVYDLEFHIDRGVEPFG